MYVNWPVESSDETLEYLGRFGNNYVTTPVLYEEETDTIYESELDEEYLNLSPKPVKVRASKDASIQWIR